MMDWYYEQLEHAHPVTWEEIGELKSKNYDSGREIIVGDVILIGVIKTSETTVAMVKFHKDELNTIYKVVHTPNYKDSAFPLLKKIA